MKGRHGLFAFVVPILLFASTACFALGLVLPIAVFERLFVFTDRPSLIGVVNGLWRDGDVTIAVVVAMFSILFPAAKLLVLHFAACQPDRAHWVGRVGLLSKWSMADVLVVAIAIFAAKTSGLAEAATQAGIWFYATAALLSAIAAAFIRKNGPKEGPFQGDAD